MIALFASLGIEVVQTVSVFGQVEMRVADCDAQSWPVGRVREFLMFVQYLHTVRLGAW